MTIDYHGFHARVLENDRLRLDYLVDAGPRIVGLYLKGTPHNLLAELPDLKMETPHGFFRILGGHRLWHAPESFPGSYIPDDTPPQVEALSPDGVRLTGRTEESTGLRKTLEIRLDPNGEAVQLQHWITNDGGQPVACAVWALTMLPLGGVVIFPQSTRNMDADGLLPNRNLVLWPYSSWQDARLQVYDDFILLAAQPALPPIKIGALNHRGCVAYLNDNILLVKRFNACLDAAHVDYGCNSESYCSNRFVELETLSPLRLLQPGERVGHAEIWVIHKLDDISPDIQGVRRLGDLLA